MAMVAQVVRPVQSQAGPNGKTAKMRPHKIIQPGVFEQRAVGRVVHQNRQAQLAPADQDHRQDKRQRVGPHDKQCHGQSYHTPRVKHQIKTHGVRASAQERVLFGGELGLGRGHGRVQVWS